MTKQQLEMWISGYLAALEGATMTRELIEKTQRTIIDKLDNLTPQSEKQTDSTEDFVKDWLDKAKDIIQKPTPDWTKYPTYPTFPPSYPTYPTGPGPYWPTPGGPITPIPSWPEPTYPGVRETIITCTTTADTLRGRDAATNSSSIPAGPERFFDGDL